MAVQVDERLPDAAATPPQYDPDLEQLEVQLLLEGIFKQYGFDFRSYAYASVRRRLWKRIEAEGLSTISGLQERVLHEPAMMERLLLDLSINVTAMFRDPGFYRVFREQVVPTLRTYPFIRLWHAGCATGEEVYSMAMLLEEDPNVDVVLMDVMMPEMDGYETMKAIREKAEFKSLPIIALTAKAMKGDREKCIAAGASDYIMKPVDTDQLISLLRVWLYK